MKFSMTFSHLSGSMALMTILRLNEIICGMLENAVFLTQTHKK